MCITSHKTYEYGVTNTYYAQEFCRIKKIFAQFPIESQIELQGYPLDIDISNGGSLLVLTAQ